MNNETSLKMERGSWTATGEGQMICGARHWPTSYPFSELAHADVSTRQPMGVFGTQVFEQVCLLLVFIQLLLQEPKKLPKNFSLPC